MSLNYLALGDSYTIGEGLVYEDTWPYQLKKKLYDSGVQINNPEIIATTGWTTAELIEGINQANPKGKYELVSLLIGVNNQYRGQDIEVFRKEFLMLLDRAINFADGNENRVFVVSIPDWGITPFAANRDQAQIAQEIDQFNTVKKQISKERGVLFIDITPFSRDLGSLPGYLVDDKLHYSSKMYALWADVIFKESSLRSVFKV